MGTVHKPYRDVECFCPECLLEAAVQDSPRTLKEPLAEGVGNTVVSDAPSLLKEKRSQ